MQVHKVKTKGGKRESKECSGSSRVNEEEKRWKRRIEEEFSGGQFYRLPSTGAFHTLKGHLALGLTLSTLWQDPEKCNALREKGRGKSSERFTCTYINVHLYKM